MTDRATLTHSAPSGSRPSAVQFIQTNSRGRRALAGPAEGISIHFGKAPNGQTFIGVIDGDAAWIIPCSAENRWRIEREVREACYEEAEAVAGQMAVAA